MHTTAWRSASGPTEPTAMTKVLITGGAGFIGQALTERLRDAGDEVVGLDMQTDKGAGIVAGDITDTTAGRRAFEGCETVIHTAAAVTNTATPDFGWRVNVLGTKNVIDAAVAAGAKRFVHFSSVRAFGDLDFPDGVTEEHPVRPDSSVYVNTKIASEQVALQAHAAGRIEVTVVRPGDVYGPGSRPWTILIVEAIRSGQFVLPAMGKGIFSPVYIDNLVDGVAARRHPPRGRRPGLHDLRRRRRHDQGVLRQLLPDARPQGPARAAHRRRRWRWSPCPRGSPR